MESVKVFENPFYSIELNDEYKYVIKMKKSGLYVLDLTRNIFKAYDFNKALKFADAIMRGPKNHDVWRTEIRHNSAQDLVGGPDDFVVYTHTPTQDRVVATDYELFSVYIEKDSSKNKFFTNKEDAFFYVENMD